MVTIVVTRGAHIHVGAADSFFYCHLAEVYREESFNSIRSQSSQLDLLRQRSGQVRDSFSRHGQKASRAKAMVSVYALPASTALWGLS